MAIIEKPGGPTEIFATPEEALQLQEPVMRISAEAFNVSLASSDVQSTLANARAQQKGCTQALDD